MACAANGSTLAGGETETPYPADLAEFRAYDPVSVKELLTSELVPACFYTERRDARPCCEGLAIVRYGRIALCLDCDRRRSAVGKGTAPVRLSDPGPLVEVVRSKRGAPPSRARASVTPSGALARPVTPGR